MKKLTITLTSFVLLMSLVACSKTTNTNQTEHMNHKHQEGMDMSTKSLSTSNENTIHSNIKNHISTIKGVNNHALVVNDKDIVVGLDLDDKADRKAIEQQIHKKIADEHSGYNVHVTSDSSFYNRIETMGRNMKQTGEQSLNTLGNDIKTLINDIGASINKAVK